MSMFCGNPECPGVPCKCSDLWEHSTYVSQDLMKEYVKKDTSFTKLFYDLFWDLELPLTAVHMHRSESYPEVYMLVNL